MGGEGDGWGLVGLYGGCYLCKGFNVLGYFLSTKN